MFQYLEFTPTQASSAPINEVRHIAFQMNNRLTKHLDEEKPRKQDRFQSNYSTMNNIFALKKLLERAIISHPTPPFRRLVKSIRFS